MRSYVKEIPGKVHEKIEDSHGATLLQDAAGKVWGLYMVADGLSGYAGVVASHFAIQNIQYALIEKFHHSGKKVKPLLQDAIKDANEKLFEKQLNFTTLSLVLISEDHCYLAHLGDSRIRLIYDDHSIIATPDQGSGSGKPKNYLGEAYIDGKSIEDRLILLEPLTGKSRPRALQLETDGLFSRLTEEEIGHPHLHPELFLDPAAIFDYYESLVRVPSGKIKEMPLDKLQRLGVFSPHLSQPELADLIIRDYRQRENYELINKVDALFKFDDTTIVYVDLQDTIEQRAKKLHALETTAIPALEQERDELSQRVEKSEKELAAERTKNKELSVKLGRSEEKSKQWKRLSKQYYLGESQPKDKPYSLLDSLTALTQSALGRIFPHSVDTKKELDEK